MATEPKRLRRLLIDAEAAFPYQPRTSKQKTAAWAQTAPVAAALAVLPEAEKARVLKYFFPRDAALSLASYLLKHYVISQMCNVPWKDSAVNQEKTTQNGKPYFAPGGIEFNVSHHGASAVMIATVDPEVRVGIDLTQIDTTRDGKTIQQQGFEGWVRIFQDVFSEREVQNVLRAHAQHTAAVPNKTVAGMRAFYSHWALKEAYFKMTGDALLSSWLQELEFGDVVPPTPAGNAGPWTQSAITKASASLRGVPEINCQLELMGLGSDYIVASSVTDPAPLPDFELIDVARDVLPVAPS